MATLNSELEWVGDTTKKWRLSMAPTYTASDNIGIPSYPFIKKVYISLEDLRKELAESDWNITNVKDYLKTSSTFIRVTETSDESITSVDTLAASLVSKITADWYQGVVYENQDTPPVDINVSAAGAELEGKNPYLLRTKETEHISIEGWVYFKDESLENISYTTYDEAKKIKDSVEHRLEWMTKTENSDTYSPLSAGIASISPHRANNLPNSMQVTGIRAGDTIRLNISGGSGEYTITTSNAYKLEELSYKTYRVIANEATTLELLVADKDSTNISTTITLTIETEEMEA